ncbi:hypothetical protein N9L19_00865 [bacterium]|nr:hypothetical protein [bacterium]
MAISIDDVIAKMMAADNDNERCLDILSAAITLGDSRGRDRAVALRRMASSWGVTVIEKVDGNHKPRASSALAEYIQASVCKAAGEHGEAGAPEHGEGASTHIHIICGQIRLPGGPGQVGGDQGQSIIMITITTMTTTTTTFYCFYCYCCCYHHHHYNHNNHYYYHSYYYY